MNLLPSWPRGSLIENVAVHPTLPRVAVACTNAEAERGGVMVLDAQTGALPSVFSRDGYVGWSDPGLLRWHPDGQRIATNVDTNGIALLGPSGWIGSAYPDDTRDGGVRYVWVDERMFTDTSDFFEISAGDARFEFETSDTPALSAIEWNANIGAVVGRVGSGVAAYDPRKRAIVYETTFDDLSGPFAAPSFSPNGRWCVALRHAVHPAPDQLLFIDGDTGRVLGPREPSSARIDEFVWGPTGELAVRSHMHHIGGPPSDCCIDLFVAGELRRTLRLGARRSLASYTVADATGIAWSPDANGVALLLDGEEVVVHDARTGVVLCRFHAPAPAIPRSLPAYYRERDREPGGLLWLAGHRLLRVAPHFLSAWTMDGQRIVELVVP